MQGVINRVATRCPALSTNTSGELPIFSAFCGEPSSAASHRQDVGTGLREKGVTRGCVFPAPPRSPQTPERCPGQADGLYKQLTGERSGNLSKFPAGTAAASPFPAGSWHRQHCLPPAPLPAAGRAGREGTRPQARGQSPGWQLQLMAGMPAGSRCPFPRAGWECWHPGQTGPLQRGDPLAGCPGTAFDVTKELCSPSGTGWGGLSSGPPHQTPPLTGSQKEGHKASPQICSCRRRHARHGAVPCPAPHPLF